MSKSAPLIVGNWKMFGRAADVSEILAAAEGLRRLTARSRVEAVLCPPFPLLGLFAEPAAAAGLALGAQDVDWRDDGAHTGGVSAGMLRDLGARYVIVGHSERRRDHHETDQMVRAKAEAALKAGVTPIICVGETWEERDSGRALAVTVAQTLASLPQTRADQIVIAYEPIWAIGSGRTPQGADIETMHSAIRGALGAAERIAGVGPRILYGGSVKPANSAEILALAEVDGALVGAASLKAADFLAIVASHPDLTGG